MILLVPEQMSHELERRVCEYCGHTASLHVEVLSFTRLCSRVFEMEGGIARRYMSDEGKTLVMYRALELAAPLTESFSTKNTRTRFIESLLKTAAACRAACITPNTLLAAANKAEMPLKNKMKDIAIVLEIYQGLLKQDLHDPDERPDFLCDVLDHSSVFNGVSIWVDGFRDFTGQQIEILKRLLLRCTAVTVSLPLDWERRDCPAFFLSIKTYELLCKIASLANVKIEEDVSVWDESAAKGDLAFLEGHLFGNSSASFSGQCQSIRILSCNSRVEEFHICASKLLELARQGVRWSECAVAVGEFVSCRLLLLSTLDKYGIPYFADRNTDISQLTPVVALTSAVRAVLRWDYDSIFVYLKTGYAGITVEECDKLENYVLTWNIRGRTWYEDAEWTMNPSGFGKVSESDLQTLRDINTIKRKAVFPLKRLFLDMKGCETAGERITALFSFAERINLYEKIEEQADKLEELGLERLSDDCLSVREVLTKAAEQYYLTAGDMVCSLQEFYDTWMLLISKYSFGKIPSSLDCVFVGDMTRLRRKGIKHLFVLNMNEAAFSNVVTSADLFSDDEITELLRISIPISLSSEERQYAAAAAAYDLLTLPAESLTVSCADDGTEHPSRYIGNISHMFHIMPEETMPSFYRAASISPCRELALSTVIPEKTAMVQLLKNDAEYCELRSTADEFLRSPARISAASVEGLYGTQLSLTASRVNLISDCHFGYFLEYGLRADRRKTAELSPDIRGNFVHYVLEQTARDVKALGGFAAVSNDELCRLAEAHMNEYDCNCFAIPWDAARTRYLFDVLCDDTIQVLMGMAEELRGSEFVPLAFEMGFGNEAEAGLPAYYIQNQNQTIAVRGVVDRVDGWEHDGNLYLRVVDYKTGNKVFRLTDVIQGKDIQLLLYLFAIKRYGISFFGKPIVPAGALYAPARNDYLLEPYGMPAEKVAELRAKQFTHSGILLQNDMVIDAMEHGETPLYLPVKKKDGLLFGSIATEEQLNLLNQFLDRKLCEIGEQILSGDVSAEYSAVGNRKACDFCVFQRMCLPARRKANRCKSVSNEDFWMFIGKENDDGAGQPDK